MFEFQLDPVLKHREHLEQEAQRRVAEAAQRLSEAEAGVRACAEARADLAAQARRSLALSHARTLAHMELFAAWRQELRRQEAECAARAGEARGALDAARQALVLAHREHRKIEHMRARAWRDHLARLGRQERRFLDDLTVMRHGRHSPSPTASGRQEDR
jgi:flagellar export protein FliJ